MAIPNLAPGYLEQVARNRAQREENAKQREFEADQNSTKFWQDMGKAVLTTALATAGEVGVAAYKDYNAAPSAGLVPEPTSAALENLAKKRAEQAFAPPPPGSSFGEAAPDTRVRGGLEPTPAAPTRGIDVPAPQKDIVVEAFGPNAIRPAQKQPPRQQAPMAPMASSGARSEGAEPAVSYMPKAIPDLSDEEKMLRQQAYDALSPKDKARLDVSREYRRGQEAVRAVNEAQAKKLAAESDPTYIKNVNDKLEAEKNAALQLEQIRIQKARLEQAKLDRPDPQRDPGAYKYWLADQWKKAYELVALTEQRANAGGSETRGGIKGSDSRSGSSGSNRPRGAAIAVADENGEPRVAFAGAYQPDMPVMIDGKSRPTRRFIWTDARTGARVVYVGVYDPALQAWRTEGFIRREGVVEPVGPQPGGAPLPTSIPAPGQAPPDGPPTAPPDEDRPPGPAPSFDPNPRRRPPVPGGRPPAGTPPVQEQPPTTQPPVQKQPPTPAQPPAPTEPPKSDALPPPTPLSEALEGDADTKVETADGPKTVVDLIAEKNELAKRQRALAIGFDSASDKERRKRREEYDRLQIEIDNKNDEINLARQRRNEDRQRAQDDRRKRGDERQKIDDTKNVITARDNVRAATKGFLVDKAKVKEWYPSIPDARATAVANALNARFKEAGVVGAPNLSVQELQTLVPKLPAEKAQDIIRGYSSVYDDALETLKTKALLLRQEYRKSGGEDGRFFESEQNTFKGIPAHALEVLKANVEAKAARPAGVSPLQALADKINAQDWTVAKKKRVFFAQAKAKGLV